MAHTSSSPLKISIIIPAYNEAQYIGTCLQHLTQHIDIAHEIIVVDNASTDDTAAIAQTFPGVRVVYESQKGPTHARARGAREATGDILAYIDADSRITATWHERVHHYFTKHDKIVCLSGPYVFYDVSALQRFVVFVYWYMLAFPMYWITGYMATGGNLILRRETLDQMNGFNHAIPFYGDDTDIARRARKFGKVKFTPRITIASSARRLNGQGWIKTAVLYVRNFLSVMVLHQSLDSEYIDVR